MPVSQDVVPVSQDIVPVSQSVAPTGQGIDQKAEWIISQAGLQSLMAAGISMGWLQAWLLSAGASEVRMHLFESNTWQQSVDSRMPWQLFYAKPDELSRIDISTSCYQLLLPVGDIVHQRCQWLSTLPNTKPALPLYIRADDTLPIALEVGLSASLSKPDHGHYLNAAGLLIEEQVINTLKQHRLSIRTVESCTAGAIVARLCRVPGSSEVVDRAWVTYSNTAKQEEAAVDADLINHFGAVSQQVVTAMAESGVDAKHVCLAVSGIAGPGGGTKDKPVGTVWIACAITGKNTVSRCLHFRGVRHEVQTRAVIAALGLLLTELKATIDVC